MAKISSGVLDAVNTNKFDSGAKKETLVNPDTVPSGATAKPADTLEPGTKDDLNAVRDISFELFRFA